MHKIFIRNVLHNQFLFTVIIVLFLWLLVKIKVILILFFISYILMAGLLPAIHFAKEKHIPKILAILILYSFILIVFSLLIYPLIPLFTSQTQSLFTSIPLFLQNAGKVFNISINSQQVSQFFSSELNVIGTNTFALTTSVFSTVFSGITIFVITFYLLSDYEHIQAGIINFFFPNNQKQANMLFHKIEEKLGAWIRGQLLLSFLIGLASFVAYSLLHLPYALPLALIAGVLEIIPTLGPLLAAVPAVIVGLTISFPTAGLVVLAALVIQALENNIVVPKVMQHAVGLHPLVVILAIVIGGELLGVIGAILAIPFTCLVVIIKNWRS